MSGTRKKLVTTELVELVRSMPGRTTEEITELLGFNRDTVHKRLKECESPAHDPDCEIHGVRSGARGTGKRWYVGPRPITTECDDGTRVAKTNVWPFRPITYRSLPAGYVPYNRFHISFK